MQKVRALCALRGARIPTGSLLPSEFCEAAQKSQPGFMATGTARGPFHCWTADEWGGVDDAYVAAVKHLHVPQALAKDIRQDMLLGGQAAWVVTPSDECGAPHP